MINIHDKRDCCGCNACVQRCPKHCIVMREDSEGFLYPHIDEIECINCGLCEKICPVINQGTKREPLNVFAAKNPNEEIRQQSSSGGIFTMLAEHTVEKGGVVFGACFNDKWEVVHDYAETKEEIAKFRGSKYVQSRISESFKQAEVFLKQGREVLFSGTPCQIAGLRLFLRKEYDNLLTVDFICHGVPSPGVFQIYLSDCLQTLSDEYGIAKEDICIDYIVFRDKTLGWRDYQFVLNANVKSTLIQKSSSNKKNPYLRGFINDLYLRPSCHFCPVKELKSGSDITLADYWGIEHYMPNFDDNKGVSAVLINSEKGKIIYQSLNIIRYPGTYESIKLYNAAVYHSTPLQVKRKDFFKSTTETFSVKVQRLCKVSFYERVRIKLKVIKYKLQKYNSK